LKDPALLKRSPTPYRRLSALHYAAVGKSLIQHPYKTTAYFIKAAE
jgi:hypothetical protein